MFDLHAHTQICSDASRRASRQRSLGVRRGRKAGEEEEEGGGRRRKRRKRRRRKAEEEEEEKDGEGGGRGGGRRGRQEPHSHLDFVWAEFLPNQEGKLARPRYPLHCGEEERGGVMSDERGAMSDERGVMSDE
eukprot:GHVU01208189.1.p4 GENE.GHVU01208189.1~~GHVU01208189.1.p4  ORF type:complete len:133 (-),score=39.72 GHVU01208189.1:72-470(-)